MIWRNFCLEKKDFIVIGSEMFPSWLQGVFSVQVHWLVSNAFQWDMLLQDADCGNNVEVHEPLRKRHNRAVVGCTNCLDIWAGVALDFRWTANEGDLLLGAVCKMLATDIDCSGTWLECVSKLATSSTNAVRIFCEGTSGRFCMGFELFDYWPNDRKFELRMCTEFRKALTFVWSIEVEMFGFRPPTLLILYGSVLDWWIAWAGKHY